RPCYVAQQEAGQTGVESLRGAPKSGLVLPDRLIGGRREVHGSPSRGTDLLLGLLAFLLGKLHQNRPTRMVRQFGFEREEREGGKRKPRRGSSTESGWVRGLEPPTFRATV